MFTFMFIQLYKYRYIGYWKVESNIMYHIIILNQIFDDIFTFSNILQDIIQGMFRKDESNRISLC
jgi:hypothetical protein